MDVSELRKRILRALDEARHEAAAKRTEKDAAGRAFDTFLESVAVPLLRQAQGILKAEHQSFTVHAPAGSARLASDAAAQTFIEFVLDVSGDQPQVLGRVSRDRGRGRVVIDERPVATGKPVADVAEEDVAAFLVTEIPRLLRR